MHRFGNDWEGQTVLFLGNGTSIEEEVPGFEDALGLPFSGRDDVKVVVTNGGYRLFPLADVLMCSDRHWLAANSHDLSGFRGEEIVVTQPQAVVRHDWRMHYVKRAYIDKVPIARMFSDPGTLVEGHTSTSTSISMAVLRGAKRILLLGVDLAVGPRGKRRAGESTRDTTAAARVRYAKQAQHLTKQSRAVLAAGVEVWNCGPPSILECYPYAKFGDVL